MILGAIADYFVNPFLLTGLLLISAPIILHLLNKRRFDVVDWAVMDFLFDAQTQNRRRMRFEDLLLLLLRILGIAFLVMAFSRPLLTGLGGAREDERIVVIDDSFSMEAVDGATNVLGVARNAARGLIEEAVARAIALDVFRGSVPPGERWAETARLGRVGASAVPDVAEAEARYDKASGLLDQLTALEASDLPLSLPTILDALGERAEADDEPRTRTLYILSDFRRVDWLEKDGTSLHRDLRAVLEDLGERQLLDGLRLECMPVAGPHRENLAVVDVRVRTERPLAGHPVEVIVSVKNFGERPRTGLRGWLEVGSATPTADDGGLFVARERVPLDVIASLAPGESATTTAEFQVEDAGSYPLRVQFSGDLLLRDDGNYAVVEVRRGTRVLLVDGSPGPGRFGGEAGFLNAALAPRGDVTSGVLVREHQGPLTADGLLDTDVVLLLNRGAFTEGEREALANFVEFGGGVGFFLGNQVRPDDYERAFATAGDSRPPLFPARLGPPGQARRPDGGLFHVAVAEWSHPAFAVFRGVESSSLERVGFSRFFAVEPLSGASVLARYDDAARTPAIVEASVLNPAHAGTDQEGSDEDGDAVGNDAPQRQAAGRVVVFNSTADRDWGDWPRDPSYPIAMQEWVKYLAPRAASERTVTAGEPLLWRTHVGVHYEVLLPDGRRRSVPSTTAGAASFEETEVAGLYCVVPTPADPRVAPPAGALEPIWFACRRDPAESDLLPVEQDRLVAALAESGLTAVVHARDDLVSGGAAGDAPHSSGGRELWRLCAMGLGALLLLELVVAWWLGRRTP